MKRVNEKGIAEIEAFLNTYHNRIMAFDRDMLRAWAKDAEFQLSEGNTPSIEISARNSLTGCAIEYTISENGIS